MGSRRAARRCEVRYDCVYLIIGIFRMGETLTPSVDASATGRRFPALLVLFVASGCSALIYEIVWYQLLQLVMGSTAVSLGTLLAVFMGGLARAAFCCRSACRRACIR